MTRTDTLGRLCACSDAIEWVDARAHLSDLEIWQAVDRPEWLLFVLRRVHTGGPAAVERATRPLLRARREALAAALHEYSDAYDWVDQSNRGQIEGVLATYTEACRKADLDCCAMIRNTLATPTRAGLEAAAGRPLCPDGDIPF